MTDKNANKIGYKKTKLGWIPENWKIVRLENCFTLTSGITKPQAISLFKDITYKYPIYGGNGIIGYTDVLFLKNDTILIGRVGEKCGCVYLISNSDGYWVTDNALFINSLKINFNFNFMYYQLLKQNLNKLRSKSGQPLISQKPIYETMITFPPIIEQEKIAEVLSCWDDGIEVLEKLLEKKQLHKKALMRELLSGKIPLKNSKNNNSYKKTSLGKIPSNWTVVKLKNIFTRLEEKNSKKNMLPVLTNSATQGVIYQNEYFDRSIVSETNTNNYYIVYPNAFMYNPRISKNAPAGPINKNKLGEIGIASPLYTVFYSKNDLCNSFYELYFNTNLWNKYMFNVANQGARHDRLNVTTKDFINMPLPCPPINEQQEIVEVLSSYDEEIRLLDKKLEMLKLQKKGLMQKLLTGEIRVKEI